MSKGYVYVLSNPSMPGIVKIGRSIHGGKGRADTLYRNDTGVATPFVLEFEVLVDDCIHCEKHMHEMCGDHRVNSRREFFKVGLTFAKVMLINYVAVDHGFSLYKLDEQRPVNVNAYPVGVVKS